MTLDSKSVQTAIEVEEKGYRFYKENAGKATNKFSRKVLESLAQQELNHKEKFEEIAGETENFSGALDTEDIESNIKDVFEEIKDKDKKEWKEKEADVYEKALEMEKKTYRLYRDMLAETDDSEEKKFLEAVMKEESKHEESLQNVLYYITDQEWWMADEESKTWNWMNI